MVNYERAAGGRVATGTDGLDAVLGGGLPASRLYLIEGDPGSGKTTLALSFLLDGAKRGEPVLYVTLSETAEEIAQVAVSHGWTLDGVDVCDLAALRDVTTETEYTLFHPSEVELDETTRVVLDRVERTAPRRVVFDSLSEMRLLARDPLRYRRQILALKQFFAGRDCTVVMLDDRTADESDRQLQSIAHGAIRLEALSPEYGGQRRRLQVMKLRGVAFAGGYHDFTIETGGLRVYPRLVASDHHVAFSASTVSSEATGLDDLLGGGLDAGTSTMITGPAGCGKSTLALAYAVRAGRRDERAAIFTFDEGRATMITRADAIGLELSAQIDSGNVAIRQVDPAELAPGQFAHEVRDAVERDGARVVVIDSLNGYLSAMPEERFLSAHLHELLAYLAQRGVATIVIMGQYGLFGSHMAPPVDVSYLADTVLLLRYFEAGGEVRQAISVVKKRGGAHERTIREFRIDASGVQIGEPLKDFHGVLTGAPSYLGASKGLLKDDDVGGE